MLSSKLKGLSIKGLLSFKKSMSTWDSGRMAKGVEEENRYGEMGLVIKDIG
mgnify:CR=1 FL=1